MCQGKGMNDMETDSRMALPAGTLLQEKYEIKDELGRGGYGLTYLAQHAGLEGKRAVKEFFPTFAARDQATKELRPTGNATLGDLQNDVRKFYDEARCLEQCQHRNIVRVYDVLEDNGTAYIVMDYEDGKRLGDWAQEQFNGKVPESVLLSLLSPLLDGLEAVHGENFLHRDIAPDNIIIRNGDHSPVLLDFGAARPAGGGRSKSVTAIFKPNYSPPEQDSIRGGEVRQGAYTDIYALSATLYNAMTGEKPVDGNTRQTAKINGHPDPMRIGAVEGYSDKFVSAVKNGMEIKTDDRPQNIAEWRKMFPFKTASQLKEDNSGWSGWKIAAVAGAALAGAAAGAYLKDKTANADENREDDEDEEN